MNITWKERLGLHLLCWGARLYFTFSKNSGKYPDYDQQKVRRFIEEINGDLLEAHTTQAGGHGFGDSEITNPQWVGPSIILVLKNAFRMVEEPSGWVLDLRRHKEKVKKAIEGPGGQPGGPGGQGSGVSACMSTKDIDHVKQWKPKKKKKKKDKKKDKKS